MQTCESPPLAKEWSCICTTSDEQQNRHGRFSIGTKVATTEMHTAILAACRRARRSNNANGRVTTTVHVSRNMNASRLAAPAVATITGTAASTSHSVPITVTVLDVIFRDDFEAHQPICAELGAWLFERPNFDDAMRDGARRFGHHHYGVVDTGRLDYRESREG